MTATEFTDAIVEADDFLLHQMVIFAITTYGLRVDADWSTIKRLVDHYDFYQRTLEEAVEELKRENGE